MTDFFDPDRLSAIIVQVKNKTTGDPRAGDALRPIGIPNDLPEPLPYLAILMELGTESTLEGGENMTTLVPSTTERPLFQNLRSMWTKAAKELRLYHEKPAAQRELRRDQELKDKVEVAGEIWSLGIDTPCVFAVLPPKPMGSWKRQISQWHFKHCLTLSCKHRPAKNAWFRACSPLPT
jgi:hypothetical protein